MTINTKFDIGDRVYYLTSRREMEKTSNVCELCHGSGFLGKPFSKKCDANILDGSFRCIDGYWHKSSYKFKVVKGIVDGIMIDKDTTRRIDIEYSVNPQIGLASIYAESDLFATQKEAQAKCDKENESNKGV